METPEKEERITLRRQRAYGTRRHTMPIYTMQVCMCVCIHALMFKRRNSVRMLGISQH